MTAAAAKIKPIEADPIFEADPVDPLRAELSASIADRAARREDVAEARQVVARLTSAVEKAEAKRSIASVRADFERADLVEHMLEAAKNRAVETQPFSTVRRDLALASEEVSAVQAALDLAQSRRSQADAVLAEASVKVERAISALFGKDLARRIEDAEQLHDRFMSASNVIDEIVKDADLPEDLARRLRLMRLEAENLQFFDHDLAFGPARAWKAAREALRDDFNAPLPG